MRKIILLLFFPIVINAQSNYDNWITPIADIEFSNGKVIYYYVAEVQPFSDRIVPLSYSRDILLIYPVYSKVNMEQKAIDDIKASLNDYLRNWSVQYSDNRDENKFIKYCCLQIIWDRNNLPENALNALSILKNDLSILTAKNAAFTLELYNSFNQQKKFLLQYKTDTINNRIATNIPSNLKPGHISQNRWEVYLGHPNRTDYSDDLIETYDNGYILAGGYNGIHGMIIKTGINGDLLYEKDYQQSNAINVMSAIQDSMGNTYQCGLFVVTGTASWPYLAKFDSCGNKVWCKVYYNPQEHMGGWANGIVFGNEGEIIVLTYLNEEEQNRQIFLFSYDTDGNNLWIKPYATHDDHPLIALAASYHLLKDKKEFFISGYCYWPFPGGDTNHVYLRPFFIGIDSNYNEKWILPWAVEDSIFGDAYVSIALNDSIIVGVGERWLQGNEKNSIFMFYNKDGEEKGYVQIPNEAIGPDIIANVSRDIEMVNDTLLITSSIWGSDDDGILSNLVLGLDGTIYNLQEITGNLVSNPHMIKTSDSAFLVTIDVVHNSSWDIFLYKTDKNLQQVPFDTNQYTYDSLCPHPITSGTIDLSDCIVWTDTEEIPTPENYYSKLKTIPIKAYPNPAKDKINFALENTDKHRNIKLECYDIFGRHLHEQKIYSGQLEAESDVSEWGSGIYVAVVKSNGKIVGKTKFIVE